MNDFILVRRGRNALSSVLYVVLNIALAIGSTFLTLVSGSWILGALLVLLSKWRVIAVRPRYWWVNIKGNLVDFIVGVSMVFMVYYAGTELNMAHILITVAYTVWLVAIKPKSSEVMTELQAILAVFFGMGMAVLLATNVDPILIVVLGFVIGYGAARHVFGQSEDHDYTLVTLIVGLLMAELSWIMYHWVIVYSFGNFNIVLPQLAMLTAIIFYVFVKGYKSALKYDGKIKAGDIVLPAIFSGIIVFMMIIYFSKPIFNV